MKPELSEVLFIKDLYEKSLSDKQLSHGKLDRVDRLTGDASTRRYYRLYCEKGHFVVCLDNPIGVGEEYDFLKMQRFLKGHQIRVPEILDFENEKGYLLEEDLGDITLLNHLSTSDGLKFEYECYRKCIDELLKMHSIQKDELIDINLYFDYKKLMDEVEFSNKFFVKRFLAVEDENISVRISQEFVDICKRLSKEKMVYTHRDYHSRNVMVKNGEFIVIDFQDARQGIPQYDLVSLLEDCYYSISDENKDSLIKYYWDNLDKCIHGQNDFEYFMSLYKDMAIQRVYKAIGSFSFIFYQRKDFRYLKYIGFAMEKLRTIMITDDRYTVLRKTLFKYYYES
jgi:N-acetylmuramate 1-kinase